MAALHAGALGLVRGGARGFSMPSHHTVAAVLGLCLAANRLADPPTGSDRWAALVAGATAADRSDTYLDASFRRLAAVVGGDPEQSGVRAD